MTGSLVVQFLVRPRYSELWLVAQKFDRLLAKSEYVLSKALILHLSFSKNPYVKRDTNKKCTFSTRPFLNALDFRMFVSHYIRPSITFSCVTFFFCFSLNDI